MPGVDKTEVAQSEYLIIHSHEADDDGSFAWLREFCVKDFSQPSLVPRLQGAKNAVWKQDYSPTKAFMQVGGAQRRERRAHAGIFNDWVA